MAESNSPRPSPRRISMIRTARLQKSRRFSNLKRTFANILAALKRGYHKVEEEGRSTFKVVELDSAEREYLQAKAADLRVELFEISSEIKDYTQYLKSLSHRAKKAHRRDLKKLQEKARIKKASKKIVDKVEKIVTPENLSDYPLLASYKDADVNGTIDFQNLMEFFSTNLAEEYKKFNADAELTNEVFTKTVKHIREISRS